MPEDPSSDDLDRILEENPNAGELLAPRDDVQVHLEVVVDAATLNGLTNRAAREGRDVAEVVEEALRSAAA